MRTPVTPFAKIFDVYIMMHKHRLTPRPPPLPHATDSDFSFNMSFDRSCGVGLLNVTEAALGDSNCTRGICLNIEATFETPTVIR